MMYTYSGLTVLPHAMTPDQVKIEDLAHHLALCNRFAGATRRPISVAQHSVWCSVLLEDSHPQLALRGLLHDGAEAYVHDVTKWVKGLECMAGYRQLEKSVQAVIYAAFGITGDDPPEVQAVDRLTVRYEMMRGFGDLFTVARVADQKIAGQYPPLTSEERALFNSWEFWTWDRAEREFLHQFNKLTQVSADVFPANL